MKKKICAFLNIAIIAVVAFVGFDEIGKITKRDIKKSMIWTVSYAIW